VNKLAFLGEDIPAFIEVDFTILTIIILYEPSAYEDIHSAISNNVLLYMYRTYN
jgi:hypothetical protein